MNSFFKYIIMTVAFALLSSGVVIATFLDVFDVYGYTIFLLLIPSTLIFFAVIIINNKVLVSDYLLHGRFGWYCLLTIQLSLMTWLMLLGVDYIVRTWLGVPYRITDYSNPWILVDTFSNSVMFTMVLGGLGMLKLFRKWDEVLQSEQRISDTLREYINNVSERLNFGNILKRLSNIKNTIVNNPLRATEGIEELSDSLREQLYKISTPPIIPTLNIEDEQNRHLSKFLVSHKFQFWRHIVLLSIIFCISFGTFFYAPDKPEFNAENTAIMLGVFFLLAFFAYINILWLYRRLKRHRSFSRYIAEVTILLLAIVTPLIGLQIITYEPSPYSKPLQTTIAFLATLSFCVTLFLYIGGISAVLMLRNWMMTSRRMTLLQAESVRQEYAYLRKQINPHFLFNVLNNIGISILDDPKSAFTILDELIALLQYQFERLSKESTTVGEEVTFLRNYLNLEKSRRDRMVFSIQAPDNLSDTAIPTLLLIPFVENATKYAATSKGERIIDISFSVDEGALCFRCSNTYNPERAKSLAHGGIGHGNTRRRLDLLFPDRYSLRHTETDTTYTMTLTIPLDYEMYNS